MSDVDILVSREHLEQARSIAEKLSYVGAYQEFKDKELSQLTSNAVKIVKSIGEQRIGLDLHWNIIAGDADRRSPDMTWFWEQIEPCRVIICLPWNWTRF